MSIKHFVDSLHPNNCMRIVCATELHAEAWGSLKMMWGLILSGTVLWVRNVERRDIRRLGTNVNVNKDSFPANRPGCVELIISCRVEELMEIINVSFVWSSEGEVSRARMAPERFVRIVQIFGRVTLIWPPEPKASNFEKYITNGAWYFTALLNVLSIFLTIRQLGNIDNDPVFLTRTLTILVLLGDSFFHLVLVRFQWQRFEILVHEVTDFLKAAKTYEKLVCRKYVRRYLGHHTFLLLTFFAVIATFFIERHVTKPEYPLDNLYSPTNHTEINRIFIRTLQYFMVLEPMCLLSGDFMIIMLLWYCSARLELLGESMHHVHDPIELRKCARRHENIISFVKETNLAIDLIILKSLTAVSIVILCAALQLSHHSKWPTLSQFFLIICVASVRLFGCAWAGDDLTEMASRLSWSIYQCPAIFRSLSLSRSASIIIQTSKRSLVVTVLGRNLVLSLRFFSRYSIKVVSFFMTLRACIERYV